MENPKREMYHYYYQKTLTRSESTQWTLNQPTSTHHSGLGGHNHPPPPLPASASACIQERKLAPPPSLSDTRDSALTTTSNDDLESIVARSGAESEEEDYDNDSMRTFSTKRLESRTAAGRNTKLKTENSTVKIESETHKECCGRCGGEFGSGDCGELVKEDASKIITENMQTSGGL